MMQEYNKPEKHQLQATAHSIFQNASKEEILEMLHHKIVDKNNETLLHAIFRNENLLDTDIIEISTQLLIQGVNPNIRNNRGETVLHLAAARRMKNAVDILLKFGADMNAVDEHGDTLAHFFIKDEYGKCKQIALDSLEMSVENLEKMKNDSMTFLEFLISKGFDFDRRNNQGLTAVHLAITFYLQHFLPTLLEHTKDIKSIDKTLLQLFLEKSALERKFQRSSASPYLDYNSKDAVRCVKILLERGVPLAVYDKCGHSFLWNCFEEKQEMVIIETLINHYLNNCHNSHFATTLFNELMCITCERWALFKNIDYFLAVLRDLVARGARVDEENRARKRPVHIAMEANNIRALRLLKDIGADFSFKSVDGENLLHLLVKQSSERSKGVFYSEACDLLVCGGCEVNVTNKKGSPLHMAVGSGNITMVRKLIEHGADVTCKDHISLTPLHRAAAMGNKAIELVELLLTHGADVNVPDSKGDTPLHFAAYDANLPIVQLLIKRGASVNRTNTFSETPLHRAVKKDQALDVIELLLDNEADVNAKDDKGNTPLLSYLAVGHANLSVVRLLIDYGAFVNVRNRIMETPLHFIVVNDGDQAAEVVVLLLENGASMIAKDYHGKTPVHKLFDRRSFKTECRERILEMLLINGSRMSMRNNNTKSVLTYSRVAMKSRPHAQKLGTVLLQHGIKFKAAKLPLSTEYKAYARRRDHPAYYAECKAEIERLKNKFLDGSTSLYAFLHMNTARRAAYIKNEELLQLIESPDFDSQFPNYSILILASYHRAVARKSLLKFADEAWYEITKVHLPDCIDQIFDHLSNADLVKLIDANNKK